MERYQALKQHVRGRTELALGSVMKGDFLDRWEPSFGLNLADVPAGVAGKKGVLPITGSVARSIPFELLDLIRHGKAPPEACATPSVGTSK